MLRGGVWNQEWISDGALEGVVGHAIGCRAISHAAMSETSPDGRKSYMIKATLVSAHLRPTPTSARSRGDAESAEGKSTDSG